MDSRFYDNKIFAEKTILLGYNATIINYYNKLANELDYKNLNFDLDVENLPLVLNNEKMKLAQKANSILNCNNYYILDKYDKSKIKDLKKTYFCKDKFCNICKKMKQCVRTIKFKPYLEVYKDKLYHMILTVPNCNGDELDSTIKKMQKNFKSLIRFFTCNAKIAGVDFKQYGYIGALRSFEVTFHDDEYHPHYHVAIAFNNLDLNKINVNPFSYKKITNSTKDKEVAFKKGGYKYYLSDRFSDFEILIQKIWYLLNNDLSVTKKAIDKVELGYSCIIKEFKEDDYVEIFKYMTKGTQEKKKSTSDDVEISYDQFKVLNKVLNHLRQIQGYGCFYNLKDIEPTDQELEQIIDDYNEFIKSLNEHPITTINSINDLMMDNVYKIISRNRFLEHERIELIKERIKESV